MKNKKWVKWLIGALVIIGGVFGYVRFFKIDKNASGGTAMPDVGPGNWVKSGAYYVRPNVWRKGSKFSADNGVTWVSEQDAIYKNNWVRPA